MKRKKYVAVRGLSYGDMNVSPGEEVPKEIIKSSSFGWLLKDGDIEEMDNGSMEFSIAEEEEE